jgi:hypothetical protein
VVTYWRMQSMQNLCLHCLKPDELPEPPSIAFITALSMLSVGISSKHIPHLTAVEGAPLRPSAALVLGPLVAVALT